MLQIANGLVQQLHSANQYFLELRSRSLFEKVRESSEWNPGEFLMHDLINDLAQIASSNLCIRLEENQGSHILEQSRHMSYSMGLGDFEKLKPLYNLEQLRTLLPINIQRCPCYLSKRVLHDIFPRLTSLRALSLSHYQNRELPNDLFIKLKHLRFLDLSRTLIKKLPDSICLLHNLETLLLSHCRHLTELPLHMEKLINLRHLDISKAYLMTSLHLSKLKNLPLLVGAKFLLGGHGGSRIKDLGELHNLYGSLSILGLQHVVDRRESLKANMREKKHVERLSLVWSGSNADNSQTEREILDKLQPNTNIKEVQIIRYRGTKFPNWLGDHSFHKLTKVYLISGKDCDSLPALGQLPCLKFLTIRGMDQITEVTEEFYGSSSFTKPFNSLEKLVFAEMPEWKQWDVLGKGEFPVLEELSIDRCPKLIGKLPENLSSLRRLRISKCPELSLETPIQLSNLKEFEVAYAPKVGVLFANAQLFTSQLEGMKQIVKLEIRDCKSLTSLPISILPSTLKSIEVSRCGELKLEASMNTMFLEELSLQRCVPRAHKLSASSCNNLTRLLIPTATERLYIDNCDNLEILSVACGAQMTSLHIYNCEKLKSLPEHMQELIPSLKGLYLGNCSEIESFPEGGLPFNLQVLEISNCKKLVNGRKEWHLQRLSCLRNLTIYHDGTDLSGEKWELPCSIRMLTISNLKTLSSQLLKSLTSLEYLCANRLPQIQSLLEEGLPSSLSELLLDDLHDLHSLPTEGLQRLMCLQRINIGCCPNLQSLPESGMPSSLSKLTIQQCSNLQSLPESGLPSSLSKLTIQHCSNLQSLPESGLPSSLSELKIYDCPNLQSLPESGMPSSLSKLTIQQCSNLQSLPESGLPSSLSELKIYDCPNLQSLPESGLPSSLFNLEIYNCSNLQSLPESGMPPSISNLNISKCPLLKPLLEFNKGEYWPKIAHIPTITIDGEYRSTLINIQLLYQVHRLKNVHLKWTTSSKYLTDAIDVDSAQDLSSLPLLLLVMFLARVVVGAPTRTVVPSTEKLGKFSGVNFKGWQQRIFFWHATLGLQKFTNEVTPVPAAEMLDREKFMIIEAWKHADFLCKGYILSALEDDLYNVYSAMTTSKELWDALEKKYKTEDACLKNFVVAKFLDYKISDSKTVGSQVQELQFIFHDLIAEDMVVNESFQVVAMIEKLPPLWNDFKNYLKHKRKEMKLEDLVIRLKIEKDNQTAEKKSRWGGVAVVNHRPPARAVV
ncbi:hypothetical protein MTR67_049725 [Solanum verrucosum]|uniref:R13L1/DRL21-like LRR repeat region domain-containing protein n=1 Tax=Solanum verrucosum TaxID=315347 RepID=A0AAF0V1Y3_SOLVR|nr:hypothetical protein MTR67_049725 [Solanum verrucosum]